MSRMKLTPKQLEALGLVAAGRFYPVLTREDDGWHARWRAWPDAAAASEAVDGWVDEYVRSAAMTRLTEDAEEQRHETLHDAWMMALRSRTGLVVWDDAACRDFAAELEDWSGSAAVDVVARRSVVFTFECPTSRLVCGVPRGRRALKSLGQAAYVFSPLLGLRSVPATRTLAVTLTPSEAEEFVRTGAAALKSAGYTVEGLPERAVVTATAELPEAAAGNSLSSPKNARAIRLEVKVAGEVVTAEEIRFLLDQGSTLVSFRDHWLEVDRSILKEALRALEKGVDRKSEVLSFAMGIGHIGNLEIEALKTHGWLRGLINELRSAPSSLSAPPSSLLAPPSSLLPLPSSLTLRPYQRQGVAWLRFLTSHGFGALLADDMGLGKTVQAIGWLVGDTSGQTCPALIVAPLTLLANWRHELSAFAPSLSVYVHQGDRRHLASGFHQAVKAADVVLTSYNLLVRDYSMIAAVHWRTLVLDEAQVIKNPDSQAAKSAKALSPANRIALTGTPIENSVADIWALEDFLNPGFLGERKSFHERFVRRIALDPASPAAGRLRRALEPFVLRRVKSDPTIAAEIGGKRETREYCSLLPEERRAYEAALASFRVTEHTPGDALALLTELKLICDGEGKLERLYGLLETIFANGESALVFTQYAKVGRRLEAALAKHFARRFPFLHGGLSAREREEEIRAFNRGGATAFILSLRAGGFGLNLVKATHIIHFDRWWNPAVENQATDRAHRIGQRHEVMVHLMITEGTVEERVDELLRKKESLKGIVADGERFWEAVKLT